MLLQCAFAGKFAGDHLGLEMMAVAGRRHARARQPRLNHLLDVFGLHHWSIIGPTGAISRDMSIGDTLNRGRKPSQNTIRQFQKYDSEPPRRLFRPSMARGAGFDTPPARTSHCAFALRFPRFAQSPARPSLVGRSRHTPLTLASLEVQPGHPGVASQIEFPLSANTNMNSRKRWLAQRAKSTNPRNPVYSANIRSVLIRRSVIKK